LQDQGLGLAAISYDSRDVIATFAKQRGITFPMLSDEGSAVIMRYGLLNTVVDQALGPNKDNPAVKADAQKYVSAVGVRDIMRGMAFPGTFILDRGGRVTSRFFEDSYIERSTSSSVLQRVGLGGEPVSGMTVSTAHLELKTYPSDPAVVPGNRFSLVFEIRPLSGMHIYAPGASSYKIVTAIVAPQPFVRTLTPRYPASEIYHFVPLDERVPVYRKAFTLVQDVVLDGDPKAQSALRAQETLTITGALEYQACDDKICYNPVSVPLSWTLQVKAIQR
jgi:AhpC/TSA family/Disulphide bond corrector protein DsbC